MSQDSPRTPRSTRSAASARGIDIASPRTPTSHNVSPSLRTPTSQRSTRSSVALRNGLSTPEIISSPGSLRSTRSSTRNVPVQSPAASQASNGLFETTLADNADNFSSPISYSGPKTPRSLRSPRSGATPSSRPDINADTRRQRLIQLDDIPEEDGAGATLFIWGTSVRIGAVQKQFREMLTTFRVENAEEDELALQTGHSDEMEIDFDKPYYIQRLAEMALVEIPHLNLNLQHVKTFDERLYAQIITYPAEVIPHLDYTAQTLFGELHPDSTITDNIVLRPFNAEKTRNMRGLNPEDIDSLITITGMVIRTSTLIPEMCAGFFECAVCRNTLTVNIEHSRIDEPTVCTNCNTNHSFSLVHNRSVFNNKQMIKLQESPEDMPAGQTPHTITMYCFGDLVDNVTPGDRVTVSGIYRGLALRIHPRLRVVKSVYKTYIDVVHFRKTDVHKLHLEKDGSHLTQDRIEQILALSRKRDIYDRLAHALAPSIYEHDDIKKGILCLLFGGTKKDLENTGRGKFRADINMLLCGDPATSKSQLLQYVHKMVPRSQYTSGKGSSAVGLTAYVTKDPETHQLVLQTGALVLSDNGVCCIDEFDKMSESTRSVLHEVMEQQTMSIAKAGIICQLNARASVLAAANPVDSQWNRNKTIIENVQLPHTLLSRFDLIFLMLDPQNEQYDRHLAKHLVSLYYRSAEDEQEEFMDLSLIRDYISYAKDNINPKLTEDSSQLLIETYMKMRQVGSSVGQISAFPRQLESLIRLSEAHAKIRMSKLVERMDVNEAYRLHREALKQSAVDPLTGKVNVDILASGMSSTMRKQVNELMEVIKRRLVEKYSATSVLSSVLLHELREGSTTMITRELFENALAEMRRQDLISRDSNNRIKLMARAQTGDT